LQEAGAVAGGQSAALMGELTQSDLSGLVAGLEEEEQLFENLATDASGFELDSLFSEFEEKVHKHLGVSLNRAHRT
jgi:hypothetical protein